MKLYGLIMTVLVSVPALAGEGLPKHFTQEEMGLPYFPVGKKVPLNMTLKIPDGYKINYSPKLNVYEKQQGRWVQVQTLKEKDFLFTRTNNEIRFTDQMSFSNPGSEVALDLSVSYCKKICVINNFQSELTRNGKTSSNLVKINIKGYLPQDKVKKEFQLNGG